VVHGGLAAFSGLVQVRERNWFVQMQVQALVARGGVLVRAKICDGRDWSRWLPIAGAVSGVNEEDDGEKMEVL